MARSFTVDKNFILTTEGINSYTWYMANNDEGWYLIPSYDTKFDTALRNFMNEYFGNDITHLTPLEDLLVAKNR